MHFRQKRVELKGGQSENPQTLEPGEGFNLDLQSHPDLHLGETADDAFKDEDEEDAAEDGVADEDVVWCQSRE